MPPVGVLLGYAEDAVDMPLGFPFDARGFRVYAVDTKKLYAERFALGCLKASVSFFVRRTIRLGRSSHATASLKRTAAPVRRTITRGCPSCC